MIRLADLQGVQTPEHDTYSPAEMDAARDVLVRRGLRYNPATGVVRDNDGERGGYCSRSDIPAYACAADVMAGEFRSYIANSASRVRRGFNP